MKIAANAIRVSHKSGGGFETYVTNILNELALIAPDLRIFTLYPEHFQKAHPEQILQVGKAFRKDPKPSGEEHARTIVSEKPPRKLGLSGDDLRMIWTQA